TIMRGSIMRPMPWDHPNFTGSNPNFAAVTTTQSSQTYVLNGTKLFSNLINSPNAPFYPEYASVPVIPPSSGFTQGTTIAQLTANLPGHSGKSQFTYDELLRYRPIWDVDNDGDGIPDSIWIDPGLPMITTPD